MVVLSQCVPVLAPPLISSATGQIGTVFTLHQSVAQKPIRYVTLLFRDRRGAAFPSSQKSPSHNCPSCLPEQKPYPA